VPLSEHEQRLLEQIERGLLADDPKFAEKVRSTSPQRQAARRVAGAAVLLMAGVALMILGLVSQFAPAGVPVLGIAGFVVMFGAAVLGVQAYRQVALADSSSAPEKPQPLPQRRPARFSILGRLEARWNRRSQMR
jgi:hypothetical protein